MSRIFDSLRKVEQEAAAQSKRETDGGNGTPATPLAAEAKTEDPENGSNGQAKGVESLEHQENFLADRVRSLRAELEALLTHALRDRNESGEEFEKGQENVRKEDRESLREAAPSLKSDLMKEVVSLSLRASQQAQKRLEERTAATEKELKRSMEEFAETLLKAQGPDKPDLSLGDPSGRSADSKIEVQAETEKAREKVELLSALQAEEAGKTLASRVNAAAESLNRASNEAVTKVQTAAQRVESDLKAAFAEISKHLAEGLSDPALGTLERRVEAIAGPLQAKIGEAVRATGDQASHQLERTAQSLVETSAQLIQRRMEDALEMFSEKLVDSSRKVVQDTEKQLLAAKTSAGLFTREISGAIEKCRDGFRKTVEDLHQTAERELGAGFERALEQQRNTLLLQLRKTVDEVGEQARAQIGAHSNHAAQEARESVYKQAGQATVILKEWMDQAREALRADSQGCLEQFTKQISDISSAALEKYRQDMTLMVDDLHGRMEKAERVLGTGERKPQVSPPPETRPSPGGDARIELQNAVEEFLKVALERFQPNKTAS